MSDLHLPLNSGPAEFWSALVRNRGRTIELIRVTMSDGLSVVPVVGERTDYIFFDHNTMPHREGHVILHAVAHLLLEHACQTVSGAEADLAIRRFFQRLFPHLAPETPANNAPRGRTARCEEHELEAQLLAMLLMEMSLDSAVAKQGYLDLSALNRLKSILAYLPGD
jgi:hypothetical protein